MIPTTVSQLRSELQTIISAAVAESIAALKKDLLNEVNENLVFAEQRSDLKTLCESEQLENYNRRDNLKIFGLEEDIRTDETGRVIGEKPEQTITKVAEVANAIGATVDPVDISIAHRLPGRRTPRAVIVKFSRRIAKTSTLMNKTKLRNDEHRNEVKIFEDITAARANFLKLLKADTRIISAWTRDGSINYTVTGVKRTYRIRNLFEGVIDMGYSMDDVMSCFRGYQQGAEG